MTKKGYKQTKDHIKKIREANKLFTKEQELQIVKQYPEDKLSTYELAKIWDCSQTAINNVLKRNGVPLRSHSDALKGKFVGEKNFFYGKHHSDKTKRKLSKFTKKEEQRICKLYIENKLNTYEIAKICGCSPSLIEHIIKRNGHKIRTYKEVSSTPKAIQRSLKNGYGTKCYYKGEFFPSKFEKDGFIKLIELGFEVIHNFLGRFDAKAKKGNIEFAVEFHMFNSGKGKDRNGLTNKQYYNQRRNLLNKYGYKDLKLVVIKDLKEIENKLIKKGIQ